MGPLFSGTVLLLTVLYAWLLESRRRVFFSDSPVELTSPRYLLPLTLMVHLSTLLLRGISIGSCPVASRWEAFSLLAFFVLLLQAILERIRKDTSTSFFVHAFAFSLQFISAVFILGVGAESGPTPDALTSLHAFAALLGVAGISIAGIHGILYLLLYRDIKKGVFGRVYHKLSSLESLARLVRTSSGIAFISLTVTVGIGQQGIFSGGGVSFSAPEWVGIALVLAIWVVYGLGALMFRRPGKGGVWVAWVSVAGFTAVIVILFQIALEGFHG